MNFIRQHWFDAGFVLGCVVVGCVLEMRPGPLASVQWLSLASLFFHQFEEYRYPGTFPGMLNKVLFASARPDRYPLNMNSALIVNVAMGWSFYLLAACAGASALWLGIGTILVSVGNIFVHVFLFNFKGKTLYNPGMLTAVFLFLPVSVAFFHLVIAAHLATAADWVAGLIAGFTLNYIGIIKTIDWLKDTETPYVFPARFVPSGCDNAKTL